MLFVDPHAQLLVGIAARKPRIAETPRKPPQQKLVDGAAARPFKSLGARLPAPEQVYLSERLSLRGDFVQTFPSDNESTA